MPDSTEELQAEIERLERENRELKSRSKSNSTVLTSIEGLETFALRIGGDENILHINTAFARHLGLANKEQVVGQKAAVLRRFLNQEMLTALARPAEGESLTRLAHDDHGKVYEIKTTAHSGMLDIVMQDVTDEQQFRSLVQRYVLKDFDNLSEEDLRTFRFPERRFMTISFTDLRGFTAMTERLNPEEVRSMVNAYYDETIRAVEENDATVIQLIGDAVMAFYGAPRYFKDHALRSVKTACEQIERVNELCARYAASGKEMAMCGVGINSGDVVLGNMGGGGKQSYTALGSAVNLASRLCGAAAAGQVFLTEVVLNSILESLPEGWEMMESRSVLSSEDEDIASVRGKIEGIQALPNELRGKVVTIGPGIKSQQSPPSFIFRYLYLLKPKGAKELAVITVEAARHGRKTRYLSDERATPQESEVVIGKYHVLEAIGEGGMGKVWKARDQFGNIVAIKMLSAGQGASSTQIQRFKREADIMRKLSHHNICRIYEIGEAEGATYIAIEHVDGVSLGEILRHNTESVTTKSKTRSRGDRSSEITDLVRSIKEEKKTRSSSRSGSGSVTAHQHNGVSGSNSQAPISSSVLLLPLQRVLALMCEICEAVQFAHEHGVLHRDLKPENIMLRPDGEPVVMDFGLAKVESEEQHGLSISMEGQMVGTIEYMAPEQAQSSKHVTERADVYSLGAILYQLLTGRKHFTSSGSLLEDAQKLQEHEPQKLRQFNKEIDRDLETIVLKALRPAPVQRYTSVRHMLEDLKRYQAGDSITARAPTIADRVIKRVRKHRMAFAFSSALVLLALLFGGFFYLQWRKQWGDWTPEFAVKFSQAPAAEAEHAPWLRERFSFQNREATEAVDPWPIHDGAMVMKQQEWCWLKDVQIRGDTKVFVDLCVPGTPEPFQISINSRKKVRQSDNNPPGYSWRFGIWGGAMDHVARNETDRRNSYNSFVISSLPDIPVMAARDGHSHSAGASTREFSLSFERRGEKVVLTVNGKAVHEETYLMPLVIQRDAQGGGTAQYENIGIRTWGKDVEVRSIRAYRFKLPEKASPTIAGDALTEKGYLNEAIHQYRTIAKDYEDVSADISTRAWTEAYRLAAHRGDVRQRKFLLAELRKPASASRWWFFERDVRAKNWPKVQEVETLALWKEGNRREALANFPAIFQANPDTRIVLECLRMPRGPNTAPVEPGVGAELLQWVVRTTKLAGLDIGSLGLTDIGPLAAIKTLRGLECRNNQLTTLEPLRGLEHLRSLSFPQNRITTLEPIQALQLAELTIDNNRIENLAPVSGMPLSGRFSCARNLIEHLAPLQGKAITALDCSQNKIVSLDAVAHLPALEELLCASNQIQSLEPLRHAKQLTIVDCNANQIDDLSPLKDLPLTSLDASGNRLVTLEPFVSERNPPAHFVFDSPTLPDARIEEAIASWTAKGLPFPVRYAQLVLLQRQGRLGEIKSLGAEYQGRRYLYVQKSLSAPEAEEFCAKVGGHLVTLADKEENAFLSQITPPGVTCRIGLLVNDGQPQWITGEPVKFVPDLTEFRQTDKVVTWKGGFWFGPWRDRPMPFIVEWE